MENNKLTKKYSEVWNDNHLRDETPKKESTIKGSIITVLVIIAILSFCIADKLYQIIFNLKP